MSQRLELSVEGSAKDGDVLMVDGWPNFKTAPLPKCIHTKTTVYQPTKVEVPIQEKKSVMTAIFLWWLIVLTITQVYLMFRRRYY